MLGVYPNLFGWNFIDDTDNESHIYEPYDKVKNPKKETIVIYGDRVVNINYIYNYNDNLPKANFKVIVDTTYTISRSGFEYKNYYYPKIGKDEYYYNGNKNWKLYDKIIKKITQQYVECYPVLVYNASNKKSIIGTTSMIQEARDSDGKWKPIEFIKWGMMSCIKSPEPILFPKHYMGATVIKYYGNFKTKLRVKYFTQWNVYYSNEFTGYINKSQFSKIPYLEYYNRNLKDGWPKISLKERLAIDFLDYQRYKNYDLEP